jgi:hypothetical protein
MLTHVRAAFALALLTVLPLSGHTQVAASSTATTASASAPALFSSSRTDIDAVTSPDPAPASSAITRGQPAPASTSWSPLHRIALGSYTSPLGVGVGAAAAVTRSTNVRLGWNFFNYNITGTDDGANYSGHLHFRSLQASLDWFPFHGSFHVSPGLLFNNQNRVTAQGGIAGGQSFTLNDVNYYSSNTDPVTGNGTIHFNDAAPMLTVGWGNWISRREHQHLAFPFEVGFAYTGDATVKLNLQGTVCEDPHDVNCSEIATDPSVQANIAGQIGKLQKDLQWIRFYPILSGGVAYKF